MKMKVTLKKTEMTIVRNPQGFSVRRCCASCQHKCIENDGKRCCDRTQKRVEQQGCCEQWQMSEGMKNAGRIWGKVKRKDYLLVVLGIRMEERNALERGIIGPEAVTLLETVREQFENENGSIYCID
jgi:hypothetical protein